MSDLDHFAECIRRGDDPRTILGVAVSEAVSKAHVGQKIVRLTSDEARMLSLRLISPSDEKLDDRILFKAYEKLEQIADSEQN
jgi:hypothetical protein